MTTHGPVHLAPLIHTYSLPHENYSNSFTWDSQACSNFFTMLTISIGKRAVGLRPKGLLILNRVHKWLTIHLGIIDMRFYFLLLQIFLCRKDDFPAQKSLEKQTTVLLKFVDYEIAIVFARLDTVLKWNTSMNTCFVPFQYLCPQNLIHRHVYNTIWMWNNTSNTEAMNRPLNDKLPPRRGRVCEVEKAVIYFTKCVEIMFHYEHPLCVNITRQQQW